MKGLLFTYLLTYGGAVVGLLQPHYGLLVYVCFAIIKPHLLWYWSVPEGNYSRVVAVGLLAGWALRGFGGWRFGRARAPVVALLGFLGWAALSAAFVATEKTLAWGFVEILAKIVLPVLVGMTVIDTLAQLKQLAWVIVLSEGYLAYEFNLTYLGGYNRLWLEGFGDMDNNCNAIALVTSLGLALFLGLASEKWWQKVLALGAAALMGHAILFSFSRGGMLALIVTGVVAFGLIPKRPVYYLGLAAAAGLTWRFTGPEVLGRFLTVFADSQSRDASADSRLVLWRACLDCMSRHPLGVGAGNWGEVVSNYGFPRGKLAHTLWLQTGAELGVVGLALLVSFYGLCVLRLWPWTREKAPVPDPWFRHLARMVTASLAGFAVAAQFVSLNLLEHPYYTTLLGAALLKLGSRRPARAPPPAPFALPAAGNAYPPRALRFRVRPGACPSSNGTGAHP